MKGRKVHFKQSLSKFSAANSISSCLLANPSPSLSLSLGNAYFYGLTITEDLDAIRNILGVCPQHDVLWGDLTAYEHMQLFGHLKGISRENMATEIQTLLEEVQLNHVSLAGYLQSAVLTWKEPAL